MVLPTKRTNILFVVGSRNVPYVGSSVLPSLVWFCRCSLRDIEEVSEKTNPAAENVQAQGQQILAVSISLFRFPHK